MATKKISELEAANTIENNDVLPFVDVSEGTTKKIKKDDFLFDIASKIGIAVATYDGNNTYNIDDIVINNETIYKCKEDNVTGEFDSTKWDEISLYEYQKIQDKKLEENYKYIGEVDYFVFYNQKYDIIALVPIEEIGEKSIINLRMTPPKNGQIKGIRFFKDYTFDKYFGE